MDGIDSRLLKEREAQRARMLKASAAQAEISRNRQAQQQQMRSLAAQDNKRAAETQGNQQIKRAKLQGAAKKQTTVPTGQHWSDVVKAKPQDEELAMQQKAVVDYLKSRQGKTITIVDIENHLGMDLRGDSRLLDLLKRNVQLTVQDDVFQYKPEYDCRTAEEIEVLLAAQLESGPKGGLLMSEMRDSNPTVETILEAMKKEGRVITAITSGKSGKVDYVCFSHPSLLAPSYFVDIDSDFKKEWEDVKRADEVEMQTVIDGSIMVKTLKSGPKAKEDKKKKKVHKIKKVQNKHVTHLINFNQLDE
eukprot:comp4943_c0_seq1/m.1034 comp4943_c0_seq1/g.1034  ORF comp4943_c0_seq1/g.1034 comp4943_c0_seq1/m.1034 type:complete len:305 (-) comp4943_c0_seq1:93-1007(-)